MPAPVEVQIVASLDAQSLSRAQQQISRSLGSVTKDFDSNLQRAEKRIISFTSIAGVIYTVQKGFMELVKSTIEVEKSLIDINVIAQTSTREIKKFGDELFKIARDTGQTFSSVAKAATELSRQGLSLQETLKRTNDALVLTRLSGLGAEDAVSSLTATINSFSKSMLTSTDIVNKFAAVDAKFAVSSADLAEAVKRVGSSAQEAGVDLDELIAIVTTAQQTTARGGAVIGNALKTIFQKIERPQVLEQLELLGVVTRESNGEMLSATKILTNLATAYDKLAQANKSQIAEMVGGIYQVNVLKATLGDLEKKNGSTFLSAKETSKGAGNVAIERSQELNKSLSATLNRTLLNFQQGGAGIFDKVFSGQIKGMLNAANDIAEGDSIGKKFGVSFLTGLAETFKNQGLLVIGAYFTSVVSSMAKGLMAASSEISALNQGYRQSATLQAEITLLLQRNPSLIKNSATAQAEIVRLLQDELIMREKIAGVALGASRAALASGIGVSNITGNLIQRKGKIGGFADPLRAAIQREVASGVPSSSVMVGSHPMLASGSNPGGLGVYNTIDEPRGLSQGISRSIREGKVPGNYGIPGFAWKNSEGSTSEIQEMMRYMSNVGTRPFNSPQQIPMQAPGAVDPNIVKAIGQRITQVVEIAARDYGNNPNYVPKPSSIGAIGSGLGKVLGAEITAVANAQAAKTSFVPPPAKNSWFQNAFSEKNQGKVFMAGLGIPIAANTMSDMIGQNSKGSRLASGVVSGVGDVAGNTILAGMLSKNPAVAAGAGIVTALSKIYTLFKDWNDVLPELADRLEASKKKVVELDTGFNSFMKAMDILNNPDISLSQKQLNIVQNQRDSALSGFSAADRLRINTAFLTGGPQEASRVRDEITGPISNQNQINAIGNYLGEQSKRGGLSKFTGASMGFFGGQNFTYGSRSLDKRGIETADVLRTSLTALTNTKGQNLESLLVDDDALRNRVFKQIELGVPERALASALGPLGVSKDKIAGMLSGLSESDRSLFLNSIFTGSLSKGSLESLKGPGQKAKSGFQDLRGAQIQNLKSFNRLDLMLDRNRADQGSNYDLGISGIDFGMKRYATGEQNSLKVSQLRQDLAFMLPEASMNTVQAAMERSKLAKSSQFASYYSGLGVLNNQRTGELSKLGLQNGKDLNSSVGGMLSQFLGSEYGKTSGIGGQIGIDTFSQQNGRVANLNNYLKNVAAGAPGASGKLSGFVNAEIGRNEPRALEADTKSYYELLIKIQGEIQKKTEERLHGEQKINQEIDARKKDLEDENALIQQTIELEEQRALRALKVKRVFNTRLEDESRITDAILGPQKVRYAARLYEEGRIGTPELESARGGAMEAYRGAYGVNGRLEAANAYAGFKNQFSYSELDKMRELEKSAVDLGATMKSSFADAFKSFSMGTQSAGQAFKSFGMGILDRISSIVSNISTNMLFGAIGSMFPASGFMSSLGSAMKGYSSGGLVTGGSGIRDDVSMMASSGDFMMKKSAVNKYGVSFMSTLNNAYDYNDPKHPTSGSFNIDSRLSSFALEDENNPQNALRRGREEGLMSYIKEKEQYDATKSAAMKQYRNAQNQRLIGAYISAGIMIGGTALRGIGSSSAGSMSSNAGGNYTSTMGGRYTSSYGPYSPQFPQQVGSPVIMGRPYAAGGSISGGSSRGDNIPILAMGGEYMIKRDAVNRIGVPTLNMINAGRYAAGGLVLPGPNTQVGNQSGMQDSVLALLQSINLLKQSIEKPNGQTSTGKTDGGITYYSNISINLNKTGEPQVQSETKSTGGDKNNDKDNVEALKKFSNMIDSKIYEAFNKESKPGGLLRNILAA